MENGTAFFWRSTLNFQRRRTIPDATVGFNEEQISSSKALANHRKRPRLERELHLGQIPWIPHIEIGMPTPKSAQMVDERLGMAMIDAEFGM